MIKNANNLIKQKFNITGAYLNLNFGFIIGTNEYKDYIDKNFFNFLIEKNICKIEIMKYNQNNINRIDEQFNDKEYFCGALDYSSHHAQFRKNGIRSNKYINAGIVMMNLKAIRQDSIEKKNKRIHCNTYIGSLGSNSYQLCML